jgi:hypothetical protein
VDLRLRKEEEEEEEDDDDGCACVCVVCTMFCVGEFECGKTCLSVAAGDPFETVPFIAGNFINHMVCVFYGSAKVLFEYSSTQVFKYSSIEAFEYEISGKKGQVNNNNNNNNNNDRFIFVFIFLVLIPDSSLILPLSFRVCPFFLVSRDFVLLFNWLTELVYFSSIFLLFFFLFVDR